MSLIQFLRILMARRWIILASLITCFVIATGYASRLPERFEARARVLLDVIKPDPVTGQVIASQFVRGYTKTQTELIKDYRVAGEVVDKMGWATKPELIAEWRKDTGGNGDIRRYLAQKIIDRTSVSVVQSSNILEISYEAPNPKVALTVVDAIRNAYVDASLRFRVDSAGRTGDWYRQQADKAQAALTKAENAKSAFEKQNDLVMAGGTDAETAKLQSLQSALLQTRGMTDQREFAAALRSSGGGLVDSLRMQVAGADDQLQLAGEKYGNAHPTYLALVQRRAFLQRQLAAATAESQATDGGAAAATTRSVAQLQADYNAQKAKVLGMKGTLDKLGAFDREVQLRRNLYQRAAAKTADLQLQADVAETGLVNMGNPVADTEPSYPNVPMVASLSALGGLVFGIILAVAVELIGRRVRGAEDLIGAAHVPVLAVIASGRPSAFQAWLRRRLGRGNDDAIDPAWQPAQ